MGSLSGQVALVTGCGRRKGLGRAIAMMLAGAGADVAVTDVEPGGARNDHESDHPVESEPGWLGLPSLVDELTDHGVRAVALVGDVGVKVDVDRMVDEAVARLGRVDILVNNAAAPHGPERTVFWEVPEDAFDDVLRINTKGCFLMSAAVTRHLLGRSAPGRIVNIASAAGRQAVQERAAYSASKFAIVGLTQSMAKDLRAHGITVNAVCPGGVDTARLGPAGGAAGPQGTVQAPVRPGRLGVPNDIARTVLFLVEPAADYITGECVNVNGGSLMV